MKRPILTLALLSVVGLWGCQPQARSVDLGPQLDADGQARSVVLDAPLLGYLRKQAGGDSAGAWYDGRNDLRTAVASGYEVPAQQRSVTVTRDRQYQHAGRIYDHFSSTTYRTEYRSTGR